MMEESHRRIDPRREEVEQGQRNRGEEEIAREELPQGISQDDPRRSAIDNFSPMENPSEMNAIPSDYRVAGNRIPQDDGASAASAISHCSQGSLEGVSIEQVETGNQVRLQAFQRLNQLPEEVQRSTFQFIVGDEQLRQEYKNEPDGTTDEKERTALTDAITILDAAISYQDSLLKREDELHGPERERRRSYVFNTLAKNMGSLMQAARRVKELHELCNGLQRDADSATNQDLQRQLREAAATIQPAINQALLYAGHMKAGNIQNAKRANNQFRINYAQSYETFYYLQRAKARAEGRAQDAGNFGKAAGAAGEAAYTFEKAAKEGISLQEKEAWILKGNYRLQQAQAHAEGRGEDAKNFDNAAEAVEGAAYTFGKAAQKGISLQEKEARLLAGNYRLQGAQAHAEGITLDAGNFDDAAGAAQGAAYSFGKAAQKGISLQEKEARLLAGNYHLQRAKAHEEGRTLDAGNFGNAAGAAQGAAYSFGEAAIEGMPHKALILQGNYYVRKAELCAEHGIDRANNFTFEQYKEEIRSKREEELKEQNRQWHERNREPGRPIIWKGLP